MDPGDVYHLTPIKTPESCLDVFHGHLLGEGTHLGEEVVRGVPFCPPAGNLPVTQLEGGLHQIRDLGNVMFPYYYDEGAPVA